MAGQNAVMIDYTFTLCPAPHQVDWRRIMAFESDALAVEDALAMLAVQADLRPCKELGIEVGRGDGSGDYLRLGLWRWEAGGPRWDPT